MPGSRSRRSEADLDPTLRAATEAEYALWRSSPVLAWRARHEPSAPPPPAFADVMARETGQVVNHYATAYLRSPATAARLFGQEGRVTFLERYTVPGWWEVRVDAVFRPRDGAPASIVTIDSRIGAGADALPETLRHLAYQRFTMRQYGIPTERCGILRLTADDGGPPLAEAHSSSDLARAFTFSDVTAAIYGNDGRKGEEPASIERRVIVEAREVTPFLRQATRPTGAASEPLSLPRSVGYRDGSARTRAQVLAAMSRLGYAPAKRARLMTAVV